MKFHFAGLLFMLRIRPQGPSKTAAAAMDLFTPKPP
ncbi:hypothetical protein KR49_06315 [Synechococcus sp. KORDI-49]|nr:hypothetical protein KR49_06315 [Synechococcus sp. KORDI-49]